MEYETGAWDVVNGSKRTLLQSWKEIISDGLLSLKEEKALVLNIDNGYTYQSGREKLQWTLIISYY